MSTNLSFKYLESLKGQGRYTDALVAGLRYRSPQYKMLSESVPKPGHLFTDLVPSVN